MTTLHRIFPGLLLALSGLAAAQTPTPAQHVLEHVLRGATTTANGAPVPGANVFLLESLDGALTDAAGRFVIRTTATGTVTIVAKRIGFAPATISVPVDTTGSIAIILLPQAPVLEPITVQAGVYTAGNERGMTLTALEVVTTPGATADIARAMQTFPGVQTVDEGNALFVRGGDASETKILLNSLVLLTTYNYETPTGTYTTTVNPFLTDGIAFLSGGFGARYGNILSGVADLRSAGRPARTALTGAANLASVSTQADLALAHNVGVHATAARSDLDLLFRLNGATRTYAPAPKGSDFSGSVIYNYRPTAEIKTFALDRASRIGISATDPQYSGGYADETHSSMVQAGWKDVFGTVAPMLSVSYSTVGRDDQYGPFTLGNDERWSQLFTQTEWTTTDRVTLRAGGDLDWRSATFLGSIPSFNPAAKPGDRFTLFDSKTAGGRNGVFAETQWRTTEDLQLIAGLRTDYSSFTRERTVDPRLSASYLLGGDATLTAAAGEYHQVSDPLYFADGIGHPGIGPMSARQYSVGIQVGDAKPKFHLEIYDKRYRDLVGLTPDKRVVAGGVGEAWGLDVFARHDLWPFAKIRATYSYVDSRRTDPGSGIVARAPFDIRNSMSTFIDQALPKGFDMAIGFRYASGKPFTPVAGAVRDTATGQWTPVYGAPSSARMPVYSKLDFSFSRVTHPFVNTVVVYYAEINNVLDRDNLFGYNYSADYSQRIPQRSLFKRALFFGATLTHLDN